MNTECAAALSPSLNAAADDTGLSIMGFSPMDLVGVQLPPQQVSATRWAVTAPTTKTTRQQKLRSCRYRIADAQRGAIRSPCSGVLLSGLDGRGAR
jgi:hypothetical protein